MPEAKIGVIGSSGLYQIEGFSDIEEVSVKTPFGETSDAITIGSLVGVGVANPAFDITPHQHISAIITEKGVLKKPYQTSIKNLSRGS